MSRGRSRACRTCRTRTPVTRSPVYADLGTALQSSGLTSIRAYGAEERMHTAMLRRLETNGKAWFWFA